MAAPTNAANVKKALANPEPSTHGPDVVAFVTSLLPGLLAWLLARFLAGARSRLRAFGAAAEPLLRLFVGEIHAVVLRVFAYGCALGAMGLMAAEFIGLPAGSVMAEATPGTDWIEINRPFPAFAMSIPDFEEAPRYASWRHDSGRGRKDILTFGDLISAGATAVVELYRPGSEPGHGPEEVTASVPELRLSGRLDCRARSRPNSARSRSIRSATARRTASGVASGSRAISRSRASRSRAGTAMPAGTGRPRHARLRARPADPDRGGQRAEDRCAVRAGRAQAHLLRREQRVPRRDAQAQRLDRGRARSAPARPANCWA